MLGDISRIKNLYLVTGYTDMRKSLSGLLAIIRDTYEMDPYTSALFLFCGKRADRIKAIYYDKTGFVMLYKVLDNGRFQWPRTASEVKPLTRQQFRWLMEGLKIEQPKAIQTATKKEF